MSPACVATIDTSTTPTAASMRPAKGAQYLVCCMSLLLHEAPTTQTRIVNHPDCADKRARRIFVLSCRMHARGCRLALPGKVDPLFTTGQMQQHEHPFARLQEREQPDLIDQRTVDPPPTRTRR